MRLIDRQIISLSIVLSSLLMNAAGAVFAEQAASGETTSAVTQSSQRLPNGLYLILREGPNQRAVEPVAKSEQVLINDYRFLQPTDRDETTYLVVTPEQSIPIALSGDPVKEKDAKGRSKLLLQLAPEQVVPLEEFTKKNVGKAIAIVVGGEVVSSHKVREPIVGGRMQITRCTDNGCDVLYSELKK